MTQINLNWNDFKSFINERKLSIQYLMINNSYSLYAFDGPFSVNCFISLLDLDIVADFETNYKSKGNKSYQNGDGHVINAPTLEYDLGLTAVWKGYKYTATAGAQSFFDEQVTNEIKLRGGWYEVLNDKATLGDYIEFSIIDKDNVLGYFAYFGLTVGVDILELKKFVRTNYITPGIQSEKNYTVSAASDVVAGLYFRTSYKSEGSEDVKFAITVHYLEE